MFSVSHCRLAPSAFLLLLLLLCSCGVHASYSVESAMSALYFSKASYCEVPSIGNWTCEACRKHPSFRLHKVFTNSSYGTLAYMGVSEDRIVISFRGSRNIRNWLANIDMIPIPYRKPRCWGCTVHRGFYSSFMSLRDEMWAELQRLVVNHTRRRVLITGHSLGGAMAVLAAADFAAQGYPIGTPAPRLELYTFGAPRVGNNAFTSWVSALFCRGRHKSYRVTNNRDAVPHLPPLFLGFEHHGGEVWYHYGDGKRYRTCSDVKGDVCTLKLVEEDPQCSNNILPISVTDHLEYLGVCTSCSCPKRGRRSIKEMYDLPPRLTQLLNLDYQYQHEGKDVDPQTIADLMGGVVDKDTADLEDKDVTV